MSRFNTALLAPLAAVTLFATTGLAQTSEQSSRRAPGGSPTVDDPRLAQHLEHLKALEGDWEVRMVMFDDMDEVVDPDTRGDQGDRMEITGHAKRQWAVEGHVLQETFQAASAGPGARPRTPGIGDDDRRERGVTQRQLENLNGMGLFCYDADKSQYVHVWTDDIKSGVVLSTGTYAPASKMFVFRPQFGADKAPRYTSARESARERQDRPRTKPDRDPRDRGLDRDTDRDDEPGTVYGRDEGEVQVDDYTTPKEAITVQIVSRDRHVVRMTKPLPGGEVKVYEITYTRRGSTPGAGR